MINKVTLNGVEIPGVVYGSFHYHAQAGYPGEMRFGGVFGSYIEFDYFVPSAATLTKGDVLKYYQSVDTTSAFAPSTTTDIFVDNYIVKEVVEKNGKNHILAYNEVDLLNVDFSAHLVSLENSFPLAIYQLIQEIETVSGLSYEWAYPLPSWMYYKISYFYVDGITCRDILNYIAEFGGGLFWVKNSHIGINIIGNAYSSFYLSPERYVVTPDNADYSVLYNGNVLFGINAWYKENSFSQQEQPAIYDGLRIVSSNGAILGSYDSVSPPQKIYYVTRNLLIDNIYSTGNDTFNDYAQYLYNQSLKLFSWQSYGNTYYYVPTKVTLFPFRFPYVINSHVFIVDKGGNIVAFPIMSLDLTESGVTIEGYGQDESEKDYYTNYETSQQNQTLLTSQINSLFKSVDNIVTNMPVPSDTTPEDLGTADAGTSNEYSRADHVHNMPSASDVGALSPSDVQYTVYDSVTDIGLTSGSATIAGAWSALSDGEILICDGADFASGERPTTYGTVEIVKVSSSRGYICYHGKEVASGDCRMFLNSSSVPDGTWHKEAVDQGTLTASAFSVTGVSGGTVTVNSAIRVGNIILLNYSVTTSGAPSSNNGLYCHVVDATVKLDGVAPSFGVGNGSINNAWSLSTVTSSNVLRTRVYCLASTQVITMGTFAILYI